MVNVMTRAQLLPLAAVLVASLSVTSLGVAQPVRPPNAPTPGGTIGGASATEAAMQLGQAFSSVAERTLPAVVAIVVEVVERDDGMLLPMQGFGGAAPEEHRRMGAGSGVIIRPDGAILTNNHVVSNASRLRVRLHDGRTFAARVLGTDPATDLAVVKIEASGLPTARLGDSDAARVGEWVLAIGAPFGLEATVTHGVLSAKGRGGLGVNLIEDYLQTDASINPGNSGGALVNLRGEVLGINTMVVGRGQGIGFAVPSRIAEHVARQILASGRVTRGWIGVNTQDVTPDLERAFGGANSGAIINQLAPDGPAARAGLHLSDLVSAVNGRPVHNRHDMMREIASRAVGERLVLTVTRAGQRTDIAVTTALRPGETLPSGPPPAAAPPEPGPTGFGVYIDAIPPVGAQRLGLPPGVGVVILEVHRGGAADRAGLRPGDVILQADGRDVRSTDDVIQAARDGRAVFLVRRGNAQEYVGLNTGG